jgi:hypothetical protein
MGLTISGPDNTPPQRNVVPPTAEQSAAIAATIVRLNNWGLIFGVVGLGLQSFGGASGNRLLQLAGAGVLVVGLGFYAKMRGREAWWGLLGLLSCLGLLVLYLLPKSCHHCHATTKGKVCSVCGAPAPL